MGSEMCIRDRYLAYIQRSILMNYKKQRGTNHFIGVPVREIVQDYDKKFSHQVSGQVISQIIRAKDMRGKDWFPHLDAIVDGLEESLIDLIEGYVEQLQENMRMFI